MFGMTASRQSADRPAAGERPWRVPVPQKRMIGVIFGQAVPIRSDCIAKGFLDPAHLGLVTIEKPASCLTSIPNRLAHGHGAAVVELVEEGDSRLHLVRLQPQFYRLDQPALLVQPFVTWIAG